MPHDTRFNGAILCVNCLRPGAADVRVGDEFGSQREPEYVTHRLCKECTEALLNGWFDLLGERHTDTRTVTRSDLPGATS